jgi:ERF superfamily
MTAETPATLAEALLALQSDLPTVAKRQTARVESQKGGYSYKYAGLQAVTAAILPRLNALGLVFTARPTLVDGRPVLTAELWHAPTGERLTAEYPLTVAANAPAQAIGSAISYGRRYCLTAMVGVVAEDDDDGRAASARYDEPDRARDRRQDRSGPDEPAARGMSQPQQRRMMQLFSQAGYKDDRSGRLAYVNALLGEGRTVTSASELTLDEAGLVIATLEAALAEQHDEPGGPA